MQRAITEADNIGSWYMCVSCHSLAKSNRKVKVQPWTIVHVSNVDIGKLYGNLLQINVMSVRQQQQGMGKEGNGCRIGDNVVVNMFIFDGKTAKNSRQHSITKFSQRKIGE